MPGWAPGTLQCSSRWSRYALYTCGSDIALNHIACAGCGLCLCGAHCIHGHTRRLCLGGRLGRSCCLVRRAFGSASCAHHRPILLLHVPMMHGFLCPHVVLLAGWLHLRRSRSCLCPRTMPANTDDISIDGAGCETLLNRTGLLNLHAQHWMGGDGGVEWFSRLGVPAAGWCVHARRARLRDSIAGKRHILLLVVS